MLEVVVIGAGIAGFSTALALWERGAAVTIVEASRPGAGATGASAGMLAAQFESPEPTDKFRLCVESRKRYPEFAAKLEKLSGHGVGLRWDGLLVANFDRREHEEAGRAARWQRDAGLRAEILGPEEAARLQKQISREAISYVWLPDEGQLDSQRAAGALADAIARTEIRLIAGNGALEIHEQGGTVKGVVAADGRRLEADRIVLAAGAWGTTIAGLPRELPVRPVRGQILRLPLGDLSLTSIVAGHTAAYLVPRDDATVLAGSTMEEVGFDRSITDEARELIHAGVSRLVPGLAGRRPLEHWAGLRPISGDSSPILGPDPQLDGLFYATGYGRDGILLAPLAGTIVAELIVSGESEFDWRPFRIDRFGNE